MTRKDSDKDAERPHYYSQFWLDIAAGRRVIGGPKPDEVDSGELEILEPVPPVRKNVRSPLVDSFREPRPTPLAASTDDEDDEPLVPAYAVQVEDSIDETEVPNIELEEETPDEIEGTDDEDYVEEDAEEEGEDFFEAEETGEEEEEEDDDWSRRGRKKAKPIRPVTPPKKPKRNPRRSGF